MEEMATEDLVMAIPATIDMVVPLVPFVYVGHQDVQEET